MMTVPKTMLLVYPWYNNTWYCGHFCTWNTEHFKQ